MIYAMSDIHGCIDKLQETRLLKERNTGREKLKRRLNRVKEI